MTALPNGTPGRSGDPAPIAGPTTRGRRQPPEGAAYRRVASALGTGPARGHDQRVWRSDAGSTPATVLAVNAGGPRPSAAERRCLEQGHTITLAQYLAAREEGC